MAECWVKFFATVRISERGLFQMVMQSPRTPTNISIYSAMQLEIDVACGGSKSFMILVRGGKCNSERVVVWSKSPDKYFIQPEIAMNLTLLDRIFLVIALIAIRVYRQKQRASRQEISSRLLRHIPCATVVYSELSG